MTDDGFHPKSYDREEIWRSEHGFPMPSVGTVESTPEDIMSEWEKARESNDIRAARAESDWAGEFNRWLKTPESKTFIVGRPPAPEEVRITSITGGQKGQKVARLGGADPGSLNELARVFGYGEEKYARYNYLKGYPWSLSIDALFRHLLAFLAGEDTDKESGLLHTAHVAWHALTLTAFIQKGLGEDDRAPR